MLNLSNLNYLYILYYCFEYQKIDNNMTERIPIVFYASNHYLLFFNESTKYLHLLMNIEIR